MALIEFPQRPPTPDVPPEQTSEFASVSPIHPRTNGGVSLEPLPVYDTEIEDMQSSKRGKTFHEGIGTTYLEEWWTSDGNSFDVMRCEPLKRLTDIAIAKDVAWGTQVTGFNEDMARLFMAMGWPMVIIGPEKGDAIPLSHSAHNTHKVLDVMDAMGFSQAGLAAVEGYSRGAMIGFGTQAYAKAFGRQILYSSHEDPCITQKPDISLQGAYNLAKDPRTAIETARNFAEHGPIELATFGYQLGRLALHPRKAWHYAHSARLTPAGALQFKRTGKAVFSGETGSLARYFPEDGHGTVGLLRNSLANDHEVFEEIFRNIPGVEVKLPRHYGGHLAGMDKRMLGQIILPFSALIEQLEAGVKPEEIDYSLVHQSLAA